MMMTEYIILNEENFDRTVEDAADLILSGKLVVFPTETVYGLGADGLKGQAVKDIFKAKGRPSDNPLILHVSSVEMLDRLIESRSELADILIDAFWPGPITFVFKKSDRIPDEVTAGLDTVAVRMPNRKFALSLIEAADTPIAAPSANTSGKSSPTTAMHSRYDLDGRVDMIVDDGETDVGLESTVLDLSEEVPMILRPGGITFEMLSEYIPNLKVDGNIVNQSVVPKSPGQKYKHYAPNAEAVLFTGYNEEIVKNINDYIASHPDRKIGILATRENVDKYIGENLKVIDMGSQSELIEIAHNLFASLREFDDSDVDLILSEGFEEEGMGLAIMNRLKKACSNYIIKGRE